MLTPVEAHLLARSELLADLPAEPNPAPRLLPERIRSYRIVRRLASGGMGVVYEAVQEQPHRTVAIKVLHPSVVMRGRSAARRFEYEAEVLGYLRHPGIAQIFDAGIYDDGSGGSPYFVMEHIENAVPITKWADDRELDVRDRLELFIKVCDAVHYAHQKGVIHRDLKPENILVGGETSKSRKVEESKEEPGRREAANDLDVSTFGRLDVCPKIIDFGIARATNADITIATMQTEVGQLLGTLQYMSPEQCDGRADDLDMRSDVYSLGVVLYELLCGRLPYDLKGSTIASATRIVQEREPERPSVLVRSLRGDVETIVLKALEKDRERRYQSAADLAADIRRHLDGEPIEARRPGAIARLSRFARAHPVLLTAMVCAVMIGATAASTWVSIMLLRERPHALAFSPDDKEVRLISVVGDPLRTWRSEAKISAIGPMAANGQNLVVVGFCFRDEEKRCSLQAFRTDDRDGSPVWTMSLRDEDLPEELGDRRFRASEFGICELFKMNIFYEHPGDEIVAVFGHWMYSHRLVRVMDAMGKTLFQFWHDGNVSDLVWLSDYGLLVVLGVNGEAYWHQRGVEGGELAHPGVVFALKPQLGRVERDWLRTHPEEGEFGATWYKAIEPRTSAFGMRKSFQAIVPTEEGRRKFSIAYEFPERRGCVISWKFDHEGNVIPGSLIRGDGFNLWEEAPDPELFIPFDLPPILPEYRDRAGPGRPGVPVERSEAR